MAFDSNDGVSRLAAALDSRMKQHADKPYALILQKFRQMVAYSRTLSDCDSKGGLQGVQTAYPWKDRRTESRHSVQL